MPNEVLIRYPQIVVREESYYIAADGGTPNGGWGSMQCLLAICRCSHIYLSIYYPNKYLK